MRRTDSTATRSIHEYRSGTFDGGPAFWDSSGNGYIATNYAGDHVELYRTDGGANYTRIDAGGGTVAFAAGEIAELQIDGNDIVFFKGATEVLRATDTTHRTGLTPAVFSFAGNLRTDNHTDGAAGGQDVEVGLASETDTAFSVTRFKSKAVGLASETDTAFSVTVMRGDELGLAIETDTAFSVGKFKSKAAGLASETDSALSVTLGGDLPTSYFTAFPLTENPINQSGMFRVGSVTGFYKNPRSTPGKCFAADFVGAGLDDCLAHLVNHAVPVDHRVTVTIFRAPSYTAGDTHEIGVYLRMVIGDEFVRGYEMLFEASGSFQVVRWEGTSHDFPDNFFTGISVSGAGPGQLADGDEIVAQVIGDDFEVFKNGISVATFTDSTFSDGNPGMGFFVREGGTTPENFCTTSWAASGIVNDVVVGLASETDTAFSVGKLKTRGVGLNSETDTAFSVSRAKLRTVGLASETDSALVARPLRIKGVGLVSESDTAFAVTRRKSRVVGMPLELDGVFGVIGGEESGGGRGARRLGLGLGLG